MGRRAVPSSGTPWVGMTFSRSWGFCCLSIAGPRENRMMLAIKELIYGQSIKEKIYQDICAATTNGEGDSIIWSPDELFDYTAFLKTV